MNSLTTGEWGSFTAPRSRALGGKSGITRAKPLVLIFTALRMHFVDSIPLLILALLSAFLCYANLPPYGRPQVPPYIQEQPCQIEQLDPIDHPGNWINREPCSTAGAGSHSEARGARARASGEAARAGAREGRHEERATARAAVALTSL